MKPFDFEQMLERHGKDAIAVDGLGMPGNPGKPQEGFEAIPMWVADMNFPTAPSIQEAIIERVKHPAFGYFAPTEAYFQAIIHWHKTRKGVDDLEPAHIGFENGVLGGVLSALNVFCSRGDKVLVHTPTYIGFTNALTNSGYHIIHSDLIRDEHGRWVMDLADMEQKIVEHGIVATIFCNPHNPTGRVWTKEEIQGAMAIFEKHQVRVVSDEIWSDLLMNGHRYTATQTVSPYARANTVALYAPSKTFNLAGLVGSYHVIYNDYWHRRVRKESSLSQYNKMNVLSMHALIGAYSDEGQAWLDQLLAVLSQNVNDACAYIDQHFPGVKVSKPEGTYMLFLDLEDYCRTHEVDISDVLKAGWDVGVAWQDGRPFHGPYAIRMNLAVPHHKVEEALARLYKYVLS